MKSRLPITEYKGFGIFRYSPNEWYAIKRKRYIDHELNLVPFWSPNLMFNSNKSVINAINRREKILNHFGADDLLYIDPRFVSMNIRDIRFINSLGAAGVDFISIIKDGLMKNLI